MDWGTIGVRQYLCKCARNAGRQLSYPNCRIVGVLFIKMRAKQLMQSRRLLIAFALSLLRRKIAAQTNVFTLFYLHPVDSMGHAQYALPKITVHIQ